MRWWWDQIIQNSISISSWQEFISHPVHKVSSITIFVSGCNLDHAYCTKPGECLCDVGWSGKNCTECIVQQKCPGSCNMPAGCVCTETRQKGQGICRINDSPPSLTKNDLKHTMRDTCFMYNRKTDINITGPPTPPKLDKIEIGKSELPVVFEF